MLAGLLIVVFSAILLAGFVLAEGDYSEKIDLAKECLDARVGDVSSLTLEEAIFASLAGVDDNKVEDTINAEEISTGDCWPSGGCKIKETAQAGLAKKAMNDNVDDIVDWLYGKNGTVNELTWYLQITINPHDVSECTVRYDGSDKTVNVNEDMTLESSNLGTCLDISNSGYWLEIADSCLDKEFTTICDKSFHTNLLYEKDSGGTIFVSSETHSGASTTEKVKAKCFVKADGSCDYEGSLWAAAFLNVMGEGTGQYVPYLLALKSSNERFFPSALLMDILGSGENSDQYDDIMNSDARKTSGYWKVSNTAYNEFYDTSLAMLALGGESASEVDLTLQWLFDVVQTEEGCWNGGNIRDTSFIIYSAGWGSSYSRDSGNDGDGQTCSEFGGICRVNCTDGEVSSSASCPDDADTCCVVDDGGDDDEGTECTSAGYFCVPDDIACWAEGGEPLYAYDCATFTDFCCTVPVSSGDSCASLSGIICSLDTEECSGQVVQASEGSCCLDSCVPKEDIGGETYAKCVNNQCIKVSGSGTDLCSSDVDCVEEEGGSLWVWIIILVILIALVALGIIYKDKLRMWWYKFRGKAKTSKVHPKGPPGIGALLSDRRRPTPRFSPRGPAPRVIPRGRVPVRHPTRRPPASKPMGTKDKEMEETLNKLKEMSK